MLDNLDQFRVSHFGSAASREPSSVTRAYREAENENEAIGINRGAANALALTS
jgi:hypothetical protein